MICVQTFFPFCIWTLCFRYYSSSPFAQKRSRAKNVTAGDRVSDLFTGAVGAVSRYWPVKRTRLKAY